MKTTEFDSEFDILWNNITSNQAPGLNAYEKSVFLTKAQNQLLSEYFNHRTDISDGGFDNSEKRQIDFSKLIVTNSYSPISAQNKIDSRSFVFEVDEAILYVLNEFLEDTINSETCIYTIIPLSYDEYRRLMMKPYKYPNKGCAWRLINNDKYEVIYHRQNIGTLKAIPDPTELIIYKVRCVRRPCPIILENLTSLGVTIDGETAITQCELPEEIHHEVLERAVTLAKIAWQGSTMTQTALAVEANRK
jgi:hypothetical protein